MADRFNVGRTLAGALTSPLPVWYGEGVEPGLRVMLSDPFGLGADRVGKVRCEHLGHLTMELLARTRQQRLIRHFLDKDVLKDIERCREQLHWGEQLGRL